MDALTNCINRQGFCSWVFAGIFIISESGLRGWGSFFWEELLFFLLFVCLFLCYTTHRKKAKGVLSALKCVANEFLPTFSMQLMGSASVLSLDNFAPNLMVIHPSVSSKHKIVKQLIVWEENLGRLPYLLNSHNSSKSTQRSPKKKGNPPPG